MPSLLQLPLKIFRLFEFLSSSVFWLYCRPYCRVRRSSLALVGAWDTDNKETRTHKKSKKQKNKGVGASCAQARAALGVGVDVDTWLRGNN